MTKSKEKVTEKGGADMTQVVMNKQKTIALIAHDHQKEDLVEWCVRTQETFLMRNWNNIEDDRRGNRPSGKAVQEWTAWR